MNRKGMEVEGLGFIVGLFFFALAVFLIFAFRIIEYNEYAYEKEFGHLRQELLEPGINYVGIGNTVRVNNQIRNQEIVVDASSKDLQGVVITLNVNMRLKEEEAYNFVKNYRTEETYTQYLNNKMQERIKVVVIKYNILDFVNNRTEVSQEIYKAVSDIPELNYFEIKDISIKNIDYSNEMDAVLEQKGRVLIEREVIQRQKENIDLINQNMQRTDVDDYFKYTIANKWDGKSPLTIIETGD